MEPRINWRSHLHWHSPDCSSVRSDTRRPTATVAENVEASRGSSPCPTLPPKYVLIRHDFAAARQYCNDVIFSPISKETVYRPLSSRPSNDFPHTSKYSHGGGEGGEGGNLKGSLTLSGDRAVGRSKVQIRSVSPPSYKNAAAAATATASDTEKERNFEMCRRRRRSCHSFPFFLLLAAAADTT